MKIFNHSTQNIYLNKDKKVSFSANQQDNSTAVQSGNKVDKAPDYGVRIPIAYNHTEDIKINENLTAKCYKLANGQRVVIVPKKGTTYVKTYVNTGSFNEPDNLRGISHYIEHNLFNGSEDLGDEVFFEEVNKMGAGTNASTSFSLTDYFIASSILEDEDLENQIRLHAGMLQSPKFLTEKLEKEKKIVNSEINMCLSENSNIGYTQTLKNLFNIKSSSIDLVAGSTDNISALSREDVVKYFNENYYPANMVTVITGEVDPDETISLISKYFNSSKMPQGQRKFEKMVPIDKPVRQDIISPKSSGNFSSVFLGFAGPENNNYKDKMYLFALIILAVGLYGSRTADIERDYGTRIAMYSDRLSSNPNERSFIGFETLVSDDKVEPFLKDLYRVIDNFSKNPPTDEELQSLKNILKKDKDRNYEESVMLNNSIGMALLDNSIEQITEFDKIIDNMTSQDIANVAKKYIDLNKAALTVVHPNNATQESIRQNYKNAIAKPVTFTGKNHKVPIDMNNVSTYKTSNNYEVVLNNAPTNTVEYCYSITEQNWTPKSAATALVLSDILKNAGTKDKSINALSKEADLVGISFAMRANDYGINIIADFPADKMRDSLEYIENRIKNVDISSAEFEKSIKRLQDFYNGKEKNPDNKLMPAMFKGTCYGFSNEDILKSLETIKLEDVNNYYNEIFEKGMGCVAVTAPFNNHQELKQEIFDAVNKYSPVQNWDTSGEKIYTPVEQTKVLTDTHLKNQADIIQAYKFKHSGNIKDTACLKLLNEILGGGTSSRLFTDLRETRHLAYSVHSYLDTVSSDTGIFGLNIGTTTENHETGEKTFENIQKSLDGFRDNINKITTEYVSEDELRAAKKALKSSMLRPFEVNAGTNIELMEAKFSPYNVSFINQYFEQIDKITVQDIYNTARNIFSTKPTYSIVATKDSIEANKQYLKSLES